MKKHKKLSRKNIKADEHKPEIKEKGAGHVHAADGEHIGWGDRGCVNDAARANAADDEAQRESEIAGERGDEGYEDALRMWGGMGRWRGRKNDDRGT